MPAVEFGTFSPGLARTTPGSSDVIDGVVPKADGSYGPTPQFQTLSTSDALPSAPKGHLNVIKSDDTYARFIATASQWYELDSEGNLTSIASGYSVPSGYHESFERFGDKLIGSNATDGMRAYDFETATLDGAISGAPSANAIFQCGDMMIGLVAASREIYNSDFNDHTEWSAGAADYQPVEDGGELVGGVPISNGDALIFQREVIRHMIFGGDKLYSLPLLAKNVGALSEKSIVPVRGGAFFLDTDGFKFAHRDGVEPIGEIGGVSDWFLDQVGADDLILIDGAYDRFRQQVKWRLKVSGDSDDVFTKLLCYHIYLKRWTTETVTTSAIFTTALPGYTYDNMPDLPYDTSVDVPYDDRSLAGGEPSFAGMDGDFKFATQSGTAQAATLETTLVSLPRRGFLSNILPDTDAANATVQIGTRPSLNASTTWKTAVSMQTSGTARQRAAGKVIQGRLNIAAGESFNWARGFRIGEGAR